jgi:hypothetical protein
VHKIKNNNFGCFLLKTLIIALKEAANENISTFIKNKLFHNSSSTALLFYALRTTQKGSALYMDEHRMEP